MDYQILDLMKPNNTLYKFESHIPDIGFLSAVNINFLSDKEEELLDTLFFSKFSERYMSTNITYIWNLLFPFDNHVGKLPFQVVSMVGQNLKLIYEQKWARQFEALNLEYNPLETILENVTITGFKHDSRIPNIESVLTLNTENITSEKIKITATPNLTEIFEHNTTDKNTGTNETVITPNVTEKTTPGVVTTTIGKNDDKIYGFNSQSPVPSGNSTDETKTTTTGFDTTETTGTTNQNLTIDTSLTKTGNDTSKKTGTELTEHDATNNLIRTGTESRQETGNENYDSNYANTTKKTGTSFNTTNQQLVGDEFNLRRIVIYNEILSDMEEFLTLPIY